MSFNTTTLLTGSPTSSAVSSSDLDTESTGSFFHDRSITLGSLIGVSSILELSRRSIRGRRSEPLKVKKPCKTRPWIFSLCSRDSIDVKSSTHTTPSLGQFLAVERRASNNDLTGRNQSLHAFVPDEISLAQPISQTNSLFVNGHVAPPQSSPWSGSEVDNGQSRGMEQGNNGYGVPVLFSCMCGHDGH